MRKALSIILLLTCISTASYSQNLKKGFWGGFDMSYGLTFSDRGSLHTQSRGKGNRMQMFDLRAILGYYITESFSLGAGIGTATYSEPRINMIPIFVDVRYHPITHINENFYVGMDLGTGLLDNQSKVNPKLILDLFVGYKLLDIGNFTLTPAIGYSFYKYTQDSDRNGFQDYTQTYTQRKNSLLFRLSLTF